MRTDSDLLAAQKDHIVTPLYRIVLVLGGDTQTFNEDGIALIDHFEEVYHQEATVILDNSKLSITTDFKGYKGTISYGLVTAAGDKRSATAPVWVMGQQKHSSEGVLKEVLTLVGLPDLLAMDKANAEHTQTGDEGSLDLKTVKDILTEVVKGTLPIWAATTVYALDALVIASPTNGLIFKVTTAGTSGGSQPTFDTDIGDSTTDNTVTWKCMGKELTAFSHTVAYTPTFDSEDDLIDSFAPADAFELQLNTTRLSAIQQLLTYTRNVIRFEADGEVHFLVPTTDGRTWTVDTVYELNEYAQPSSPNNNFAYRVIGSAGDQKSDPVTEPNWPVTAGGTVIDDQITWRAVAFDEEYRVDVTGQHELRSKVTRNRIVVPNFISVKSRPDSDGFSGTAEFTDSSDIFEMEKREHFYERVTSNAQATSIAEAYVEFYKLGAQNGSAEAPLEVLQEVHDYVKLTDQRQDDLVKGNVGSLQRLVGDGKWKILIAFGDVRAFGFDGLFPVTPQIEEVVEVIPGPGLFPEEGVGPEDVFERVVRRRPVVDPDAFPEGPGGIRRQGPSTPLPFPTVVTPVQPLPGIPGTPGGPPGLPGRLPRRTGRPPGRLPGGPAGLPPL